MNLLAYKVEEGEEGCAVIVFAADEDGARQRGAAKLGVDDDEVEAPIRAPEYDHYAPGPVPAMDLLHDGWWFECAHCFTRVDDGCENDEGEPFDPVEGPTPYSIFCSPRCAAEHFVSERAHAAAEAALIESFESRYEGADIVSLYLGPLPLTVGESSVHFRFPGGDNVVLWKFGDARAFVNAADVDAFKAWRGMV